MDSRRETSGTPHVPRDARPLIQKKSLMITYQQTKGKRVKGHGFIGVTNRSGYWWVHEWGRWATADEAKGMERSSHIWGGMEGFRVRSVRVFRRRLREWSEYLPPGVEFVLVSKWKRNDVYGRTRKPKR